MVGSTPLPPVLTATTTLIPVGNLVVVVNLRSPGPPLVSHHAIFIDVHLGVVDRGGGRVDGRKSSCGRAPPLPCDRNRRRSVLWRRHGDGNLRPAASPITGRRRWRNGSEQIGSRLCGPRRPGGLPIWTMALKSWTIWRRVLRDFGKRDDGP